MTHALILIAAISQVLIAPLVLILAAHVLPPEGFMRRPKNDERPPEGGQSLSGPTDSE